MSRHRWMHTRWFVTLVSGALVGGTLVASPALASHPVATLAGSGFELDLDANLKVDDADRIDWATVTEDRQVDRDTGTTDDSFKGGTKEDTECPAQVTGSIPNNKSDLKTFGVYVEPGDPTDPEDFGFLHLFWHRVQDPSGTTLMDFEFNQSDVACTNNSTFVDRMTGDLLIEYLLDQGGSQATITFRRWNDTTKVWGAPASSQTGAAGTINSNPILAVDSDGLGPISPRTFGEASIDLDPIFQGAQGCLSFGLAHLKSRSSTSFTSQVKDFIRPLEVEVSNCGSIEITKTDDAGSALEGATFTLYVDDGEDDGFDPPSAQVGAAADTPTTHSCSPSGDPAVCTIGDVTAGSYWVVETTTPVGHETAAPQLVQVTVNTTAEVSFENVRNRGSILVEKIDGNGDPLGGAAFSVSPDGTGDSVGGTSSSASMIEVATGLFCLDGLLFHSSYTVSETTTPAGYNTAPDQTFAVDSASDCDARVAAEDTPDLTFTNNPAPGRINLSKADDDGNPLNGAVFTLYADDGEGDGFDLSGSGEPETAVATCTTGVANSDATTPSIGACSFIDVDLGDYWVDETIVPSGYAKAAGLPTQVTIGLGGSAGSGQTVNLPSATTAYVDPQQHKVIVIVCHEGEAVLAASDVTSTGLTGFTTLAEGTSGESTLCALNGFKGVGHGELDITVDVGSDAHS